MTTETAPSYAGTLSAIQAYAQLQQAAEETLAGITSKRLALTPGERQAVTAAELSTTGHDLFVELQFERPRDVHHSIVVLARIGNLLAPLELAQEDDGSGGLSAESLLQLGDIISTFLDTIAPALSWLQPTPRAWLGNLEPMLLDDAGLAQLTLPSLLVEDAPLYQVEMSLAFDGLVAGTITLIFGEATERALLGMDASPPAPAAKAPAAPALEMLGASSAAEMSAPRSAPAARPSIAAPQPAVLPAQFEPLGPDHTTGRGNSIELIREVPLKVSVELGRTSLTVREVLALGVGSVVELNRLAGEPVDVLVNDRLIARGEVVMVDESFGVRITDLVRQQR